MKIYIEDLLFKPEYIDRLKKIYPNIAWTSDLTEAKDSEVFIAFPETVNELDYTEYPNLKWVQFTTAGYDGFDFEKTKAHNILTTNAADVYNIQIAEDVFSKILYFDKQLNTYQKQMETGSWKRAKPIFEINQSTVGIIGTGAIAIEIAKRMQAFGARVIGYRRKNKLPPFFDEIQTTKAGFNQVFKESDYLVVTISLNEDTKHLIKKEQLDLMKQSALLINIARGDIIDQEALVNALTNNQIRGAGLDVTSPEPLPKDHPLWKLSNVFITPHSSNSSPYTSQRLFELVRRNLELYLNQKTLHYVVFKH
ncbi:MAG: D-2-hydroxyacid dehydrogenase [Acholeplasmataceae bacterium]